ncbi:MAG: helix-turn-helix domain-containing protein [Lachnospiraceae bacterium]
MKSVDIGITEVSSCFSFTPSKQSAGLFFYMTWCGHYFCNSKYFKKRTSYPPLLALYIRGGAMHVEYGTRVFDAQKGDVVLIDCRYPHYYHAQNGLEFVYMHFDGSNAHELCAHILERRGPLLRSRNNALIGNFLYNTVRFYEEGNIESAFDTSLRVYKLLHLLSETNDYESSEDNPVNIAIHYIHENISQKITLRTLAELTNLSVYYFSHLFKRETGYAPMDYTLTIRMDCAKALLIKTDKRVTEIAYEVGYGSCGSFINAFTDRVGCSPKIFRRLMQ